MINFIDYLTTIGSGIVIVFVGVLLTYNFYRLATAHRKWFVGLGGVVLVFGIVVYALATPENKPDSSYSCSCATNTIMTTKNDTNTPMQKVCGSAIYGLSVVNRSLSSFFPSRGGYDDAAATNSCGRLLWRYLLYWTFHFLAIIYMISIFAAVFGVELINRIVVWMKSMPLPRISLIRTFRPNAMNVFWDACEEAYMMCENAIKVDSVLLKKESIVFVLPETSRSWLRLKDDDSVVRYLARKGFTWIIGSVEEPGTLVAASRHFFLGPDGHKNLSRAEILMSRLEKDISGLNSRRKGQQCDSQIAIYVRAWSEADDDIIYKWADEWNRRLAKSDIEITVEIVREEAIVSREFLIRHSMLDCPHIKENTAKATVSGEFRILVLGFGTQGERLVGDMICDAQFVGDDGRPVPIAVDVIDNDPSSFGWFKANCTEACSRYRINFNCLNVKHSEFWDWLSVQHQYYRVIICTQDDAVNLALATDMANYFGTHFGTAKDEIKNTIFVRTRSPMLANSIRTTIVDCPYQIFGCLSDTYTVRTLLNDKWNEGAIFVNGIWAVRYDEEYKKYEEENKNQRSMDDVIKWYKEHGGKEYGKICWRKADTFNRESSRAAFVHQRNLLRLIGYSANVDQKAEETQARATMLSKDEVKEKIKAMMVNLSKSEHMRWMAFHFVRGWKKWVPDDSELAQLALTKKRVEPSSIKKQTHRHAALVDFDELEKIDEKFNSFNQKNGYKDDIDSQKKDDDLVCGIEAIFDAGFLVTRRKGANRDK